MAELNLKQIIDRLNDEFTGDTRKLMCWYDDKAEFAEDIDSVELENAKVYWLEPDNQFMIKRFLEREDTSTNYLIYAPFPKPDVKDNHLEDTLLINFSRKWRNTIFKALSGSSASNSLTIPMQNRPWRSWLLRCL